MYTWYIWCVYLRDLQLLNSGKNSEYLVFENYKLGVWKQVFLEESINKCTESLLTCTCKDLRSLKLIFFLVSNTVNVSCYYGNGKGVKNVLNYDRVKLYKENQRNIGLLETGYGVDNIEMKICLENVVDFNFVAHLKKQSIFAYQFIIMFSPKVFHISF